MADNGMRGCVAERTAALARAFGVPGFAVALIGGGRRERFTWGVDAAHAERAVGGSTWFQAASAGKHVTAVTVLDLAARGRIDLAAPIGDWLPDAPRAWGGRSVRSLLHHTSGLPDYLAQPGDGAVPDNRAAFMSRYAAMMPIAAEGDAWSYSNTNYILLGFLVAAVAGKPCGVVMEALLARAGVSDAAIASPDWVRAANAEGRGPAARDAASATRAVIGDGDVAFTAAGAEAWLRVLAEGALDPAVGVELLRPATLVNGDAPYGCGLFLDRLGGVPTAWHGGHFDGWTAMLYVHPGAGTGVFAMCNLAPGNTRAIRAIALGALEAFAPGTTPLSLAPIADRAPAFSAIVARELFRNGRAPDRARFAPALRVAIDRGGTRGVLDLWAGEMPRLALVEEWGEPARTMRRYRMTYPDRVEHVAVGMTADGLIDWAWPL
ncbi:serine hydrolase domain-containing protein [uncultured Sphingomonas sp.]|uniref:serine hydrolase domain-containing protein n=1 Tax=uncultured Sphingomonas sp. TaxID=158754 RepID=UPI0035CC4D24